MSLEQSFLIHTVLIGLILIIVLVTKDNMHRFITAFLVGQALTWLNVTLHAKLGLAEYPVREFPKATDMAFSLQYFVFPVLCGFYVLFEPQGPRWQRFVYLLGYSLVPAVLHYVQAKFTQLVAYKHYHWSIPYVVSVIVLMSVNVAVRWFFHAPPIHYDERRSAR